MKELKAYLSASPNQYHGDVTENFEDLAKQFSRLQHPRMHQGGAALCVYFQGQKVVDIYIGKNQRQNNGKRILCQSVTQQAKVFWQP